jgi:hypothetical protein
VIDRKQIQCQAHPFARLLQAGTGTPCAAEQVHGFDCFQNSLQ